jgi:hypothetical protein
MLRAMECGDVSNISIDWMDMVAETRSVVGMYDLLLAASCSDHLCHSFFATLLPTRSRRKCSPKDRQTTITPTHMHLWKPTTGDATYAPGRRPLVNNEAVRNVPPKERTPTPREHPSSGPNLKDTAYLQQATFNLCHYIEQHSNPPRPFPDLLWRLVAVYGHRLSLELKERICRVLFNRIGKHVIARTTRESSSSGSDHILGISRLNAALLATMFPCYSSQFPPGFLQRWAVKKARQTLSPTLDMEIRWNNLLLLSTHTFFGVIVLNPQSSIAPPDPVNICWRTTLTLGTIDEALSSAGHDLCSVSEYVQSISYPLWQMWKENTELTPEPIDIIRTYISAFLRIAAKSKDARLKDDCFLYCQQHVLWVYRQDNTPAMKSQAIDTIVAYILADISCAKSTWADLYGVIARVLPDTTWQSDVTDALMHYYTFQNISLAYDLYLYIRENGITASSSSLLVLGLSLASFERWSLLAPILENETFSREQTEQLLGAYLRVFQVQRHEYADQSFVALLGRIANKLYAQVSPPRSLMYPLRYFFSIMIFTHNSSDAVKLIMTIYRTTPGFFTMRLVLRLALQLVRRQQLSSAVKLYNLVSHGSPSPSVDNIRRKLTLKLFQFGSPNLARRVDRTGHGRSTLLSGRESLARAVDFQTIPLSSGNLCRDILRNVALAPTHGPTIRHAMSLLVRAGRLSLAKKLFRDSLPHLDLKTKTAIGNIILHGPMYSLDLRNRSLVRYVLRTKDFLVDKFGFIPDRTTVNVIIKAMLRWKSTFDASHVKQVFDQMVHQGYPVPDWWRRKHGVPFSTPQSAASGLSNLVLPPHISFTRHIRPMYKLFIKALYLRNDRAAAKVIIGILKMVEIQYMRESETRNRARREGIIRKRLKSK